MIAILVITYSPLPMVPVCITDQNAITITFLENLKTEVIHFVDTYLFVKLNSYS